LLLDSAHVPEQEVALFGGRRVSERAIGLVGPHVLDTDAHRPQTRQRLERVEIGLAVAPVAATGVALDRADEPDLFVNTAASAR